MFSTDDTIVAIATPPGRGGIGVVRVSGVSAASIGSATHVTFHARAASRDAHPRRHRRDDDSIRVVAMSFPLRTPTPAMMSSKFRRTAVPLFSNRSSAPRFMPARGWPTLASSRFART